MYTALCRYESMRDNLLGPNADGDLVSGAIAAVSWFHLVWICSG